jgi:hypothetical protein
MGDPVGASMHTQGTSPPTAPGSSSSPSPPTNLNPVGRVFYGASTMICTPASLDQEVGLALGAQAGEKRLAEVIKSGGFTDVHRATETPFNHVGALSRCRYQKPVPQ